MGQAGRPLDIRWVHQAWRPRCLPLPEAIEGSNPSDSLLDEGAVHSSQKDPTADIAELQRRVEQVYSELNAERRSKGALEDGLRRQSESVEAIVKESANLQAQLDAVQREVQEHVTEN